jgi:allophanate hydrolase
VLSIPSEPIVRGSIQVAGDGVATVLLADHQTTGGYPKIATVVSADLDALTQLRAGDVVEFEPVEAAEAVSIARHRAAQIEEYLGTVVSPGRTMTHRLRAENLISGAVADHGSLD